MVEAFPQCFALVSDRPANSATIVLDYRAPLPLEELPAPVLPKRKKSLLQRARRMLDKRLRPASR